MRSAIAPSNGAFTRERSRSSRAMASAASTAFTSACAAAAAAKAPSKSLAEAIRSVCNSRMRWRFCSAFVALARALTRLAADCRVNASYALVSIKASSSPAVTRSPRSARNFSNCPATWAATVVSSNADNVPTTCNVRSIGRRVAVTT